MKSPKAPGMTEAFPFTLRNHLTVSANNAAEYYPDREPVARIGGNVVIRMPELLPNLSPCELPSDDDAFEMRPQGKSPDGKNTELYHQAYRAVGVLVNRAKRGDGKALYLFAELACKIGEGLSQLVVSKPKAFQAIAGTKARWPLMRSTHARNSDPDHLLRAIKLGVAMPINLNNSAKWKPGYAANVAVDLFQHLEFIRQENPLLEERGKKAIQFATFLPPFSRSTAPKWWLLAKHFLLATYPEPEKISEFARLVTSPSKRKSPGRMRQSILETVEARFLAISA